MKRGEIWTLRDHNYASKARPVGRIGTHRLYAHFGEFYGIMKSAMSC